MEKLSRKAVRWTVTTFLVLSLIPVVNLNVERLAEAKGWDRFLSDHWGAIMSNAAQLATQPWFVVLLGFLAGGTAFMWGDYILRHYRSITPREGILSPDEALDLYAHLKLTKRLLDAVEGGVSHEGFHEAAALSLKLTKLGIQVPFTPHLKDKIELETFGENFANYIAAIEPYIRDGDITSARRLAESAIKILFEDEDIKNTKEPTDERQAQLGKPT